MRRIFCKVLLVPQNIVMDLNNVMLRKNTTNIRYVLINLALQQQQEFHDLYKCVNIHTKPTPRISMEWCLRSTTSSLIFSQCESIGP